MTAGPISPEAMRRQLAALPADLADLVGAADDGLRAALDDVEWSRVAEVRLVGDGDSHHASRAAAMSFHRFAGVSAEAVPALSFVEYAPPRAESARPLVVGVSASGATPRVLEAVSRARSDGCRTLALTATPGSPLTAEADCAVVLPLTALERSPGIRTYQASLVGLIATSLRVGEARGALSRSESDALRAEIRALADAVEATRSANRDAYGSVAELVRDAPAQLVLGSGPSHGTALYAAAKLVEGAGVFAAGQDVEEWWHVERFALPLDLPLFLVAPPGRSHWRAAEVAAAARAQGRRTVAVVDAADTHVARHAVAVLRMRGACREELSPLLYHLFAGDVAAALAEMLGRSPFQTDRPEIGSRVKACLDVLDPVPRAGTEMPFPDALARAVLELACELQHNAGQDEPASVDASLAEAGFGSLDVVRLMMAVESRFSVRFPAEMVEPRTFRTARTIAEAIRILGARPE